MSERSDLSERSGASGPGGAGGPGEMSDPPVERLAAWAQAHLEPPPPAAAPLTVERFPGGHSNLTYLLHWDGGATYPDAVLRRPPAGANIKSAHDMGREHRVLSGLHRHFSKAPRPLAVCPDATVIGAPFFVMEKVEGVILRRPHLPAGVELGANGLRVLSEAAVDGLVELHGVDWRAAGLETLGSPAGYTARQVEGWTERWMRARLEPVPEIDAAAAWLADHPPRNAAHQEEAAATVLHNDFKYDNLVLAAGLDGIVAVLDWEMATLGDPWMDVGTSLAYWADPEDEEMLQHLPLGPTALAGSLSRAGFVERYARQSGRDPGDLLFYYVFGLIKVAVIAQQIYHRYRRGWTDDRRFAALGDAVLLLGRMANQAIARRRIDHLWD